MCGRFASSLPADEMRRLFQIMGELPNVEPSWNIAPSQRAAVVRRHPDTGDIGLDRVTVHGRVEHIGAVMPDSRSAPVNVVVIQCPCGTAARHR